MDDSLKDRTIKINHFKNLVSVAFADGTLDDDEREFLEERAEELGLPASEVRTIIDHASQIQFASPDDMDEREEQLADVVFMSMVDGNIEEREYQLCLTIAQKLELKQSDLDEVIALTKRLWKS